MTESSIQQNDIPKEDKLSEEEEMEDMKKLFLMCDPKRTGYVGIAEFTGLYKMMTDQEVTEDIASYISLLYMYADMDGDSKLNFNEFTYIMNAFAKYEDSFSLIAILYDLLTNNGVNNKRNDVITSLKKIQLDDKATNYFKEGEDVSLMSFKAFFESL